MLVYAIIPARSGSKGLLDKNIKLIKGKPLLAYSIDCAKKIKSVNRVFCSTNSSKYAEIAKENGAEVPFLRSEQASSDTAMEQDILLDLRVQFEGNGIEEPDIIIWLRPTFVFRCTKDIEEGIRILKNDSFYSSARIIVESENRLYMLQERTLVADFEDGGKSVVRRQDMPTSFKVFSTDIIRFKNKSINDKFLGDKIYPIISSKICGLDIDDEIDFEIVKSLVENNKELINDFL